ncbi:MAG: DedA family protein [Thermoleophilia bacterium]|nr:DedA family protein [Thermoleophilia bacterium]
MNPLSLLVISDLMAKAHDLGDVVAKWGFFGVLAVVAGDGVLPILPGETAIVGAAVLAAHGKGHLLLVIAAGALGAMLGDSLAFWIGRWGAGPIQRFLTRMVGAKRYAQADAMVERNARPLVIGGRFLPGLRIAVNMACGSGHLTYPRFLMYESIGAVLWSTQAALLGYFAGKAFAEQTWVAFVVAGGVMVVVAFVITRREHAMRRAHEARLAAERRTGAPDPDATAG